MSYQKNSDDNGRTGGTFNDFTTEHITGKFEYGKRDRSANDKYAETLRDFDEEFRKSNFGNKSDNEEIVKEVNSEVDKDEG